MKSIAQKLLIKPDTTVWSSSVDRLALVGSLPPGVFGVGQPAQATVAIVFADDEASLRKVLAEHGDALGETDVLWVAYPKGNRTDVNRDSLWPILAEHGMRPIGQVAIDDEWSALRSRPLRDGEAPFTGGR
jgi:hypothetical protein